MHQVEGKADALNRYLYLRAGRPGRPCTGVQDPPDPRASGSEEELNPAQNAQEHGLGQPSGLRILLAWMIGAEQCWQGDGQFRNCAVGERERRARGNHASAFENAEVSVPGDFAESKHSFGAKQIELALEVAATVRDFTRKWLVFGRRAANFGGGVKGVLLEDPRPGAKKQQTRGARPTEASTNEITR